ncbi:MAG: hypothetical protein AB7V40_08145 [Methyloceanibacter sp.]
MKRAVFPAFFAAAAFLAPAPAASFQASLSDEVALASELGASAVEPVARRAKGRKASAKKGRRYDWSYYPYWRPYQYRYWQLYYPYGGPLF